jgi:malonyl-CoA/methylmalonyl-CoA synthetase
VAIWAEPSLETVVATVAALASGVTAVPLSPSAGVREVEHILADSRPEVLVGGSPHVPRPAGVEVIPVDPRAKGGSFPLDGRGDSTALILYTSGTTGPPKGVMLSSQAITSNLDALVGIWKWTRDDVLVHALPLFHVHGLVLGTIGPLRLGSRLVHVGKFSPEAIAAELATGGSMVFGVPTMYHRIANSGERDNDLAAAFSHARLIVSGSAALPAVEHERFEELTGQRIVERYGMTETIMNVAVRADGERVPGYVGLPVPGVEVRFVDDDGLPIEIEDDETIGEVQISGPNLFHGYLNRPDATSEAMDGTWFKTGDLATRRSDGYIRIVGRRATDLIKSAGFRIGAGEVEGALLEHPAVAEAAIVGMPDEDLGERIEAWVVLREDQSTTTEELSAHVSSLLTPHKRPRVVHFVDSLPRNEMGKVQKTALGKAIDR